ncbi:hypothetical protein UY3_04018 [Chelonia mydas]|uniref:Uncharacterized protein n=1 Tax=Chelonia mydas TaxID=8469 RepID=M7BN91_CHEMY|nr:hypothetical protein UY3_04018 [Chelonia mydas]
MEEAPHVLLLPAGNAPPPASTGRKPTNGSAEPVLRVEAAHGALWPLCLGTGPAGSFQGVAQCPRTGNMLQKRIGECVARLRYFCPPHSPCYNSAASWSCCQGCDWFSG